MFKPIADEGMLEDTLDARWRFALEGNGDIVFDWDLVNQCRYVSNSVTEILGYEQDELPQMMHEWGRLIHPDDFSMLMNAMRMHLSERNDRFYCEHRIIAKDGRHLWFLHRGKILEYMEDGKPSRIISTLTDITSSKAVQQEILQAKLAAEAANNAKNLFLANMSHELRTPMNGIMGMVQILESTPMDEEQQDCLITLKESGQRMMSLIDNLINLITLESSEPEVDNKPFRIEELLDFLLTLYRKEAQAKGVQLVCTLQPGLSVPFIGDREKLGLLLSQLLSNAVKFTRQGKIELAVSAADMDGGAGKSAEVLFTVKDTGIGISAEERESIFDPFSQSDNSYTRNFQGAGLGLAICRKLAGILGGNLSFESEMGRGSTFHFSIPLQKAGEEMGNEVKQRLVKALIADDDEVSRKLLEVHCSKMGLKAWKAVNGLEAVRLHSQEHFDIVFMDIQMPEMSGIDATRAIREMDRAESHKTVIIAITAYALKGDRERFLSMGMDDYISKPMDAELLYATVRKWI